MLKMSIGENIKKFRNELGFSQEDFANIAGIGTMTISNIEKNRHKPSLSILIKIADSFGVTIDEVVGHYVEDPKY